MKSSSSSLSLFASHKTSIHHDSDRDTSRDKALNHHTQLSHRWIRSYHSPMQPAKHLDKPSRVSSRLPNPVVRHPKAPCTLVTGLPSLRASVCRMLTRYPTLQSLPKAVDTKRDILQCEILSLATIRRRGVGTKQRISPHLPIMAAHLIATLHSPQRLCHDVAESRLDESEARGQTLNMRIASHSATVCFG